MEKKIWENVNVQSEEAKKETEWLNEHKKDVDYIFEAKNKTFSFLKYLVESEDGMGYLDDIFWALMKDATITNSVVKKAFPWIKEWFEGMCQEYHYEGTFETWLDSIRTSSKLMEADSKLKETIEKMMRP